MIKELWIDLETTGLSAWKHGIWQIGLIIVNSTIEEYNFLIQPFSEDQIDEFVLKEKNMIREDFFKPPFIHPYDVWEEFIKILNKHIDQFDKTDKFIMFGYNVQFDNNFLRQYFKKCKNQWFGSYFWSPPIDVMTMAMYKLMNRRHELKDFKLGTVAKYLGIKTDNNNLHDALYDIQITRQVMGALKSC